ncbi:hypothetical protein HYU19_02740 [Candidatus Woesearchaeota archaeon]|nr:hypothetical protein [Candidatus Woesearchaeota archaeon]
MPLDALLRTMQRAAITSAATIMIMWCSASSPPLAGSQGRQERTPEPSPSPSYILLHQLEAQPSLSSRVLPRIEAPPCADADGDGVCQNFPPRDCNDENPLVTQEPAPPAQLFSLDGGFINNAVWDSGGTRVAFIQTGGFSGTPYPTFSEAWLTILDILPDGSSRLSAQYGLPLGAFAMPHDIFMYDFSGSKALYGVFEWTDEELVSAYGYGVFVADTTTGESTMIHRGIGTSERGTLFDGGNKVVFECGRYKCGFPELCIANADGSSLELVVDAWTVEERHRISGWALSKDELSLLYTITNARALSSPVCAPPPFDESDESLSDVALYTVDLATRARHHITSLPLIPRYDELVPARYAELSFLVSGVLLINLFDDYGAYECLVMDVASSSFQSLGIEESVSDCSWASGSSSILLRHGFDEYQLLHLGDNAMSLRYHLEPGGNDVLNPTATSILSVVHHSSYFMDDLIEQNDNVLVTYLPCGLLNEGL